MRAILCMLLALLCLATPGAALAFDVEEFDDGWGEWEFSLQKIGRSTTDGWAIVRNDGEQAARNATTGTKYTCYWKLSRDIDLTKAVDPSIDVRLYFRGFNYDYAAVQIGPKGRLGWPTSPRCSAGTRPWPAPKSTATTCRPGRAKRSWCA